MPRSCRWTPLGPIGLISRPHDPGKLVMSGRATAIAVHPNNPNTVYVGTAGGGVWKTTDKGQVWTPLLDRQASLAIGAIAVDPSKPQRIFVGTGEGNRTIMAFNGVGLLVSENGGGAWRRVAVGLPRATRIVVSPAGNRVFVGSTEGLWEYRQENDPAGTYEVGKWTQLSSSWVSDLAYDDVADRLYAALWGDGIYARDGAGPLPKTALGSGDLPDPKTVKRLGRIALAWIKNDRATIFAAYTHDDDNGDYIYGIYKSGNSGGSWTPVAAPRTNAERDSIFCDSSEATCDSQAYYNLVFARNPHSTTDLFLGLRQIWRSHDLGQSFNHTESAGDDDGGDDGGEAELITGDVHPDQHAIDFAGNGDIWLGNDGGVWLSTNGGEEWVHRNRGLCAMQYYGGAHHADIASLAYGGAQDNGSQFREGHPLWRKSAGGDAADVALDAEHRRAWLATNHSEVEVSDKLDERSQAFTVFKKEDDSERFFTRIALAPSNQNVGYLGTGKAASIGHLYVADAGLGPWLFELHAYGDHGGEVAALAVSAADDNLLYVADVDWTVHQVKALALEAVTTLPTLPEGVVGGAIEDLAVSPRDDARVYVALGEADASTKRSLTSRLLRFDGAANNWVDLTSGLVAVTAGDLTFEPRENAIHTVVVDPDPAVTDPAHERVYIGCDRGVFESLDGGQSWRAIHDGLPLTAVYHLVFHARERTLRAFTHGRGVWERAADVEPCAAPPGAPEADLYVRSYRYDVGKSPAEEQLLDPVRRDGRPANSVKERRITLRWTDAPDIKVDREAMAGELDDTDDTDNDADDNDGSSGFQTAASTVDYTPGGALDCIGFEALHHRDPRRGATARVYLQVHNRGPDKAANVTARLFYAAPNSDGSWPDLPPDFWTAFPAADPGAGSAWKPVGAAQTIPAIRPAEPEVLRWDWTVPRDVANVIGIMAVVTSAADPVFEGTPPAAMPRAVEPLVRANKRIILKKTKTHEAAPASFWSKLGTVAKYVGIGAAIGVGAALTAYGLYEGAEYVAEKV